MLLNFRGYDTLLEIGVLALAMIGLASLLEGDRPSSAGRTGRRSRPGRAGPQAFPGSGPGVGSRAAASGRIHSVLATAGPERLCQETGRTSVPSFQSRELLLALEFILMPPWGIHTCYLFTMSGFPCTLYGFPGGIGQGVSRHCRSFIFLSCGAFSTAVKQSCSQQYYSFPPARMRGGPDDIYYPGR